MFFVYIFAGKLKMYTSYKWKSNQLTDDTQPCLCSIPRGSKWLVLRLSAAHRNLHRSRSERPVGESGWDLRRRWSSSDGTSHACHTCCGNADRRTGNRRRVRQHRTTKAGNLAGHVTCVGYPNETDKFGFTRQSLDEVRSGVDTVCEEWMRKLTRIDQLIDLSRVSRGALMMQTRSITVL